MSKKAAVKVSYQGVAGANSEIACLQFNKDAEAIGYHSFADAFDAVIKGEVDFACLPVENSLAGSVHQTYDLLTDSVLHVIAEQIVRVHHNLMVKPGIKHSSTRWFHGQTITTIHGVQY